MKITSKIAAIMLIALIAISTLSVLTGFTQAAVDLRCTASISADNSGAGKDTSYTFTITNVGTAKLGSTNITIPSTYSNIANLLVTQNPSTQTWTIQKFGNYFLLHGSGEGLATGDHVTFTFDATNPQVEGYVVWTIGANQNTGEGGWNYPQFTLDVNFLITPNLYLTSSSTIIKAGTTIAATGVLENSTNDAQGTVTYNLYSGAYPDGVLIDTQTVTVTNTIVPPYPGFTPTIAGTYYFTAQYSGDSRNTPANGQERNTGSSSVTFTVTFADIDHFGVAANGSLQTKSVEFPVTVTAQDKYGNTVTNYAGTVHLTSSDNQATLPIDNSLTSGAGIFNIILRTVGIQTISVTDTVYSSITGSVSINVLNGMIDYIALAPKSATITVGNSQSFSVEAYDAYSNSLGDVTSSAKLTAPGATVTGNSVSASSAGIYTVTATCSGKSDTATLTVAEAPTSTPSPTSPSPTATPTPTPTSTPSPTATPAPTTTQTSTSTPAPFSNSNPTNTYSIIFQEQGLPAGKSWNLTFNGQTKTSTTSTITFSGVRAGNYSWKADSPINETAMARYVITGNDTMAIQIPSVTSLTITYITQYYLLVSSPYGNPTGEGWYDAGSTANFSVDLQSTDNAGTLYAFTSWTGIGNGSYTGSENTQSVKMNTGVAQMANREQSTILYTVAESALILLALLLLAILLLAWRRRRNKNKPKQVSITSLFC